MDVTKLSARYAVRALDEADAPAVYEFCKGHTQYYRYCGAQPSLEQVKRDMTLLPEGVEPAQKHYVGFHDGDKLVAVMDMIEGYPDPSTCYIGFFMMRLDLQGAGIGTAIISEAADSLHSIGIKRLRLAIARDNPQANRFWRKNGFNVVKAVDMGDWTALVADRLL